MPQSWRRQPARSRRRFSGTGCDTSLLLSRKEINVTAATDGLDTLLLSVIRSQLAPEIAYMHVNTAIHGRHWPAQRSLRKVLTADDFAWTTQKGIQKIKFRSGKRYRLAVAGNAAGIRVQIDPGQMDRLRGRRRSASSGTAQNRAQTGNQFTGIEGFGQIVVRSQFQAQNAVKLAAAR